MEIILIKDVENLGSRNDIVNVRPGYANNYLIPQGMAKAATASAKKVLAENIRQQAHKEAKMLEEAQATAAKLAELTLSFSAKVAEEGNKIFGSITTAQVAEALEAKGFAFDKKVITIDTVKELGSYVAQVKLHKTVTAEVKFEVVAE